jgi:hypothetical protein
MQPLCSGLVEMTELDAKIHDAQSSPATTQLLLVVPVGQITQMRVKPPRQK